MKGIRYVSVVIVLTLALLSLALTAVAALADPIPVWHEPPTASVVTPVTDSEITAFCVTFERIDGATWRTESGADVPVEQWDDAAQDFLTSLVHVPPSDIREPWSTDLYWTLEANCPHVGAAG